jgi:hypothetical protein
MTDTEERPEADDGKETCAGCGERKSLTKGMIRKHTIKKIPCGGGGIKSVEQGGTVETGDVHCRECGIPAQLTANSRVKTHLVDPRDPGSGNCPGGSDFPAEHRDPDLNGQDEEADPSGGALLDGRTASDHTGFLDSPEDEEADPFGNPAFPLLPAHVHRFEWADDGAGHSGSFCTVGDCGLEEPDDHEHRFSWSTTLNASVCVVNSCGVRDTAAAKAERFQNGQGATLPQARMGKPSDDVRRAAERSRTTAAPKTTSQADAAVAAFLNGGGGRAKDTTPGPWFEARFDSTCDTCGAGIFEGDMIRADGIGGYECSKHTTDQEGEPTEPAPLRDDLEDPVVTARSEVLTEQAKAAYRAQAETYAQGDAAVAAFLGNGSKTTGTGAHRAVEAAVKESSDDAVAAFLMAGQGKADDDSERYGRWGQYKINHPDTGRQELWQRATTAAKIMANTFTLNQWHQRMTAKGMTMRDDLLLKVAGLDVKADRKELNELCEEAQITAGSKISAELGTALHAITERIDMGQEVKIPGKFQALVSLYTDTVRKSGLKIVPGMLEQTTALTQYMVAGTFDRIFQLPNGEYVIGDLKTGSSLSYGELEIEIQLAIYAHGVNTHGIWDWGSKTWVDPGFKVRPDLGVIMHMPAESVLEGEPRCTLQWVNLKAGWANLALSKQVEAEQRRKNRFRPFTVADVSPYSGNVDVGAAPSSEAKAEVTIPAVKTPGHGGSTRPKGPCPKCTLTVSLKLDGTPYDHTCIPEGLSEEAKFLSGATAGPAESGPQKLARIRARFGACTTKREASAVFKDVQGQLPPAEEKLIVDETLARLAAPAPVHLEAELSGDGKPAPAAEPVCRECSTDTHRCPGCGESVPHGTVACPECSFRIRFEEVETKADAQALWREAKEVLSKDTLAPMVAGALERLKAKLGVKDAPSGVKEAAPPAPPEEPEGAAPTWAERFGTATTKAEAKAVWLEAKGVLPKDELDPLVKATLARLS